MIYFFLNIVMYLVINGFMIVYFKNRMNLFSFLLVLFNMNLSFILIMLDYNFIYDIFFSLITLLFYHFFTLWEKSNKEIVLIKDGNINFHNLINYYSFNKLWLYLKIRNIKLDEVAYCIKSNHGLIIIKNKDIKSFPVSIIVNGNLLEENLKLISKNKSWLEEELLKKKMMIKDINYAYYQKNKMYFVM